MAKSSVLSGTFSFDEHGPPRYEQLANFFERAIRTGEMTTGARLPTVRQLAATMGISATTITSAFDLLGRRKLIKAEVGRGTFVIPDWREVTAPSATVDLARSRATSGATGGRRSVWRRSSLMRASSRLRSAYPAALECSTGRPDPKLLPLDLVRRAWADCVEVFGTADFQYAGPEPIQPLLEVLIPLLEEDRVPVRSHDVIVGSSAQQFFSLIYEVLAASTAGIRPVVVVEEPGYPTLMDTLERNGARLVGVDVDSHGAIPASLANALREGSHMVVFTPRGHNPTGASWTEGRLLELAAVLREFPDVIVVEDDQVAGIASARPGSLLSIPELETRVVYIRSFSKSIAPDLRMAAAVARPPLRDQLVEAKSYADGWSSRLLQHVLALTLSADELPVLLSKARDEYRERRQHALTAVNRALGVKQVYSLLGSDGVNVWIELPSGEDSSEVQEHCALQGVWIADGEPFFVSPGRTDVVRLNAGAVPTTAAARAGEILGHAIVNRRRHEPSLIHV